ncbi:MAG: T9SS type A sorting domain-containing protein [Bacteroidota bacterium]|nr:T9SS type A sorting domain-containing protein [Bacteroidota bacterium]
MKKLLFTILSALILQAAVAQYYYIPNANAGKNPGGLNADGENPYPAAQNVGWTTLWSGGTGSSLAYTTETALPFAFKFNGNSVTKFTAGNFGSVAFDAGTPSMMPSSYSNLSLPNANIPNNSVNILGIKPQANGAYKSAIMTKTYGNSPNRQFWIWFNFFGEANINAGWTYWAIVLEENSNDIHIVDMKTLCVTTAGLLCTNNVKLSAGIQIDGSTATSVTSSPNLAALQITKNDFTAGDNSYYTFSQGTQPSNDLTCTKINSTPYLILNKAPFTIAADFRNLGSAKATASDLNYSIDGGSAVTAAASSVSIDPLATQTLAHATKWTPTATGTYQIKVWASNINGSNDGKTTNDEATFTVTVVDNFADRVILNEVFTSSTCGPCAPGNKNYDAITAAKDANQFVTVKYQMNFPGSGDPYYTSECGTRLSYYGITSIPRMELDGGWDGNANNYTSSLFDNAQAKPAFMTIGATSSFNFNTISIKADIKPLTGVTSSSLYLFAAICEKMTTKNIKSNGETEFYHVMKKMIPNANGTLLSGLTKDVTTTKNLKFTFPGIYTLAASGAAPIDIKKNHSVEEFSDLEVVLWVQDISTKEVWQAGYTSTTFLGIDQQPNAVQNIQVIPNPTNGLTKVNFGLNEDHNIQVSIIDALGKTMRTFSRGDFTLGFNSFMFDATGMPAGVYFINFNGDNFLSTQKVIVQ